MENGEPEKEDIPPRGMWNSLRLYSITSFLIFHIYTFFIVIGLNILFAIAQFRPFGDVNIVFVGLLVLSSIYTFITWIYVYFAIIKPIFYDKEKDWSLGWYVESWFVMMMIFFIPAILIVQLLPFRDRNVPYTSEIKLRSFQ